MQKYRLVLFLSLGACTSYVPLSYHGPGSSAAAKTEASEATMYLQHINNQYQHLVFDLEVNNNNAYPVHLAPEEISYYFSDSQFSKKEFSETATEGVSILRLRKRNFTKSTHEVYELFQSKERSRATTGIIFSLIGVGLVIYDNAKDRNDSHKSYLTKKDVKQAATRDAIVTTGLMAADLARASLQQAQTESYYLPFEMFTEGSIEAQSRKRGKIFLPMTQTLRYLRIIIPYDNKEFVFDFKQKGN